MQAHGAEILRLACCYITERGIGVCAPVHDAVLVEAPLDELDAAIQATQQAMAEASREVLGGFELRTEVKQFRYPDGFHDEKGAPMWALVQEILQEILEEESRDPGVFQLSPEDGTGKEVRIPF